MRLLILTASKDTLSWKSLPNKLAEIKLALNSGKNADFTIDIQYTPAIPKIDPGTKRINHAWLDELALPYFSQGFDIIGFHFSRKQYVAWDIKDRLGGSNPNTKKEVESLYWWADEDSKRNRHNKFVETFLHEVCHGYYQQTGIKDITHETDEKHGTVISILPTLDWSLYQPRRMALKKQKNALERLMWLYKAILAKKTSTGTKPQVKPNFEPPKDLLPLVKRKADAFVKDAELLGLPIRITEGFRSFERQNELYAQGRTKSGKLVTNAKGGQSNHNYGCAIDIVFRKLGYDATQDQWLALASIAERHGFEWGGGWNEFIDRPHFELTLGYTLPHFQKGLVDYNKFN